MSGLFTPFQLKNMTLKNRIMMSPMCQYSVHTKDGLANDWHYVHYVSRAIGGTGLIMIEMTDVHPDGRITDRDLGIWSDEHIGPLARIVEACHQYGAKVGIQIGHAGRKAESETLNPVAPSAIPFSERYRTPKELTKSEIEELIDAFAKAAERAVRAGVDTIELHGAHGYLIHQFFSPLSNKREDEYGEPNRFAKDVIRAVRSVIPSDFPLIMRLSAIEHAEGGYTLEDTIARCREFYQLGVDAFDISSGGESTAPPKINTSSPAYQVPFAAAVKQAVGCPVIAVGRLDDPFVAEMVIQNGYADLVAIGRGMLRNPYWANEAALALKQPHLLPKQYERAFS
jgi:2,4-dienoyl-CoA reductase-like NADH-dependent reductase (Old Yellow Enzyme family)